MWSTAFLATETKDANIRKNETPLMQINERMNTSSPSSKAKGITLGAPMSPNQRGMRGGVGNMITHQESRKLVIILTLAIAGLAILAIAIAVSLTRSHRHTRTEFNVMDYGAVGDGKADDSQAFSNTWQAACHRPPRSAVMIIPKEKTFLVNPPVEFNGPCKSSNISVQVAGNILAPDSPDAWQGLKKPSLWLAFRRVSGLTIGGGGQIDGSGSNWWAKSCKRNKKPGCTTKAPMILNILSSTNVVLKDLKFMNSPNFHIHIWNTSNVRVTNLTIKAPGRSPNTDGIHVQSSHHVLIDSLTIGTGDDCVSIGDQTSDITVHHVFCGPGHGISVGSLGKNATNASVENIHVSYSNFFNTTNGARIKTWQGGGGYARNITFEKLKFTKVKNPIIINQYYCDRVQPCKNLTAGVKISDVRFMDLFGTSISNVSINLSCSETVACTGIILDNVNLTPAILGNPSTAYCLDTNGSAIGMVEPHVPCLTSLKA
ncbi:probable polygalacturonase At1g80170 [Magnolia sinica]|uniref:probable polygalacturonase At1g80170 n=1 Tax=Magnolia sinica TaxID=86752 RepID=UPI002659941D|nr:probable polygalacturonase At1g80170 [Magnolia sinica]